LDAYDIAGGCALLNAVGGEAIQSNGKPIRFGGNLTYQGCIAGRPELLADVVRRKLCVGPRQKRNPAKPKRRTSSFFPLRGAQGTLLGQLAGDALGSFVEFQSADRIRRDHPAGVTTLQPGGTWNLLAGQPTDDSEMALALARAIVSIGSFNAETVAEAYVGWGNSRPFDIGSTTRAGLDALNGSGRPSSGSQSNGALMRVSPIGIFAAGKPHLAADLARRDAALTHPNAVCVEASAAFAAAIAAGIDGADNRTMWSVAYAHADNPDVRACLERSLHERTIDFMTYQGWVLVALENAFRRLWGHEPLEAALIATVASGGDTDTNAAICGALLGAAQGRDAIPLQWRRKILSCRSVQGIGVKHPRASYYWPDDALDLAEALLMAGRRH
jgi:ADP-ribosyl-[dinitrogen reductase] hydrolase